MADRFSRTELLLGGDAMKTLAGSRVAVFGIGGVGGFTAEALVRSGIGAIDLIDNDTVSVTNINRQIIATTKTVGMLKTEAMRERILEINPDCIVKIHNTFYLPENADEFDFSEYDYIVDAIDTVSGKLAIAENAQRTGTPVISSMGAGNKLNPEMLEITDISKTSVCPLARVMRIECRKRGIKRLKCVYSREPVMTPRLSDEECSKRQVPGSTAFVPSVAGLIIAGEVIKDLTGVRNE